MANQPTDPHRPSIDVDEIPVEELIRLTRALTRRITNQDRQRLARALRETGHHHSLHTTAPIELQRFFTGESDLDSELAQRFPNAPLLSHMRLSPPPGMPLHRQASAILSSQDDSTALVVDLPLNRDAGDMAVDLSFSLMSMITMRFSIGPLTLADCQHWLDLIRRDSGITFLWTHYRWEHPYLIAVVREYVARLYAFSPAGVEAAVRLAPDTLEELVTWLEQLWCGSAHESTFSDEWQHRPTLPQRPPGLSESPGADVMPNDTPPDDSDTDAPDDDDLSPDDLAW